MTQKVKASEDHPQGSTEEIGLEHAVKGMAALLGRAAEEPARNQAYSVLSGFSEIFRLLAMASKAQSSEADLEKGVVPIKGGHRNAKLKANCRRHCFGH